MLYYYRLELVHLVPNSITVVASFIHMCEAYLGIPPHFQLWRYFFQVKKTGKAKVLGNVGFYLRPGLKSSYIDMELLDNTTGWKSDWFYIGNQKPELPKHTGFGPTKVPEWDM